ncbi:MAG: undecaprenyl-phosphate glucose phosphotransferase [Gammaproteobacteria bacterium]|nr:undecaprenyl-phosphate glucose phosphotransferase [Gammaproteobacteria bacterium]
MLRRGLLKEYSKPLAILLHVLDIAAIIAAGLAAFYYRFGNLDLPGRYVDALGIAAVFTLAVFSFFHVYESIRAKKFWEHMGTLIRAVTVVLMLLAGLAFLTKSGEHFSRSWFMSWAVLSVVLLLTFRCSLLVLLRTMRSFRLNERRVIIIGAGDLGAALAETLQQALWTGFRIVAIFDDEISDKPASIQGIPVQQTPENLSDYLLTVKDPIDEIWLAMPLSAEEKVKQLLHKVRHHTIAIRFVLDTFGLGLFNHSISNLAGFPALNLNASPMVGVNRWLKACEDRIFAAIILIIISPLFLMIALLVKLSSKGPVFFKQLRHGWDGKVIKIYKFRTMYIHNEAPGQVTQAKLEDRRITKLGKFLRKTSLDELPQFINVLQGRMSIVGPRPHALSHNEFYKDSIKAYMQRHKVKPGITGWAQVNGWRGETETLDKMEKRVEFDLFYIDHWSLAFDCKIILLTFFRGFFNKNAY